MTLKESLGGTALSLLQPFLFLGLHAGCTPPAPAVPTAAPAASTTAPVASELERLQGTWEGVLVGEQPPDKSKPAVKYTVRITGSSFHFHRDANFWFDTTITLPANTDPRQLHATIKKAAPGQEDAVGQVVVAIFKIEDGLLTLATKGGGDEEPPKSFDVADDQRVTRYDLRKVQPGEKKNESARAAQNR